MVEKMLSTSGVNGVNQSQVVVTKEKEKKVEKK
jgi:hypothetical protein